MRITVRVVQCDGVARSLCRIASEPHRWLLTESSEHAFVFPCESFAQSAIDGYMASRSPSYYHLDIQDGDDAERGALEPVWTGP